MTWKVSRAVGTFRAQGIRNRRLYFGSIPGVRDLKRYGGDYALERRSVWSAVTNGIPCALYYHGYCMGLVLY